MVDLISCTLQLVYCCYFYNTKIRQFILDAKFYDKFLFVKNPFDLLEDPNETINIDISINLGN